MKDKTEVSSKVFLFRFGIMIVALLTLHVLVTVYNQLGEANQILNELAEAGTIPTAYHHEDFSKQPKYSMLSNYAHKTTPKDVTKSPLKKQERFLEINPYFRGRDSQNSRTRIQENVFSYQRFYESGDVLSRMPTHFMEIKPSAHAQGLENYENNKNLEKMDKIRSILRRKRKLLDIPADSTSNDGRLQRDAKNINKNSNKYRKNYDKIKKKIKKNSNTSNNANNLRNKDNNNKSNNNNRNNNNYNSNNNRNGDGNNDGDNNKKKSKNNTNNNLSHKSNDDSKNDHNIIKENNNTIYDNKIINKKNTSKNTANNRTRNDGKKSKGLNHSAKVMILAYRRSGSSFLGEMFNRNPRVFYLFEPLHPVERIAGRGKFPLLYDTLVGHILDVIYTCSFNKHSFLVNFLSNSPFRLKSEALRSSGLCAVDAKPERILRQCKPLNQTTLKSLCNSKDHIVVKTIRASSKKTFEYFAGSRTLESNTYKLNLIHLVRDPRAIISSRLHLYLHRKIHESSARLQDNQTLTKALCRSVRVASANLCSRIYSDLKYGQQAGPNAYMLLRYEDAAMHPLRTYGLVSKFSGIKESEEVKSWLRMNTNVADARDANDEYSTSRNSTASVYGWRRMLPFTLVNEVQGQCGEVMKMLGYLPARNERQLISIGESLVDSGC